jgi:hypothetical protein
MKLLVHCLFIVCLAGCLLVGGFLSGNRLGTKYSLFIFCRAGCLLGGVCLSGECCSVSVCSLPVWLAACSSETACLEIGIHRVCRLPARQRLLVCK